VNEKTHKLQHANQSLQVLYHSSQELTASRISQENFQAILRHIVSIEGIVSAKLEIEEIGERNLVLTEGPKCVGRCLLQSGAKTSRTAAFDGRTSDDCA